MAGCRSLEEALEKLREGEEGLAEGGEEAPGPTIADNNRMRTDSRIEKRTST